MDLLKLSFILSSVFSFTMIPTSLAQDSPQDFLNAHNVARDQVGVPHLQWNVTLENYSKKYARKYNNIILDFTIKLFGNTVAWDSPIMTGIEAVQRWVNEKQYYDYNTNTCANDKVCDNYTQVVWKNSKSVGCAITRCENNDCDFIICSYDPKGNIVGEKPY